jgi:hypothetical protein
VKWRCEKPTLPGTYAWRDKKCRVIYPELASIVQMTNGGLSAYLTCAERLKRPTPLSELADREWLGPLEGAETCRD